METPKKNLLSGAMFPILFVSLLWIVFLLGESLGVPLAKYGVLPREITGMSGILFAPLIHGSYDHLLGNTFPLLILGWIMFYNYKGIAFPIFFWIYLMTGLWVWTGARGAFHIGASGIVYGFVTFLFFSGIFRKDTRLLALSLLVAFIYGSLVWGVFPMKPTTSWESHLFGSVAGVITAFYFRKEGPKPKIYDWELEEEIEEEQEVAEEGIDGLKIVYHIKKEEGNNTPPQD